jgi:hypothetical protein
MFGGVLGDCELGFLQCLDMGIGGGEDPEIHVTYFILRSTLWIGFTAAY